MTEKSMWKHVEFKSNRLDLSCHSDEKFNEVELNANDLILIGFSLIFYCIRNGIVQWNKVYSLFVWIIKQNDEYSMMEI